MNTKSQVKSREIVALQWLITPLNEELDKIKMLWTKGGAPFAEVKEGLHAIGNIFTLANLPDFANLTNLLQSMCQKMIAGELPSSLAPSVQYATRLLQYEINRFVVTAEPSVNLPWRVAYLQSLLGHKADTTPTAPFSEGLVVGEGATADEPQSATDNKRVQLAWRYLSQQLLQVDGNDGEKLQLLSDIASYYASQDQKSAKVWPLAKLWLDSLTMNETPTPSSYGNLLSRLDQAMDDTSPDDTLWLENLFIDLFVALATLNNTTDDAKQLTAQVQNEKLFFPYVLKTIEQMIYQWGAGETGISNTLQTLAMQLERRGWTFFSDYAKQIIADIASADGNLEQLAQLQWQITTQLQDFYGSLASTYASIDDTPDHGQHLNQQLRHARVLVENIKTAFTDYLSTKDVHQLADADEFTNLKRAFDEMAMYELGELSTRLAKVFAPLSDEDAPFANWAVTQALAKALSLFELFLDGLAKEVFDGELLTQIQAQITAAESLHSETQLPEFSEPVPDTSVVRYGDDGEVAPEDEDNDEAVQADDDEPTSVEPSQAYMAIEQTLKADDFDGDEDITEIFVEEADEVVETLDVQLPKWQDDLDNVNALKEIRRGFHTLKGSGRMVGANQLGELAWAVENLLNRVLDGTLSPSDTLVALVLDTTQMIGQLVQDFASKRPPSHDIAAVILQANNLLAGVDRWQDVPKAPVASTQHSKDDTNIEADDHETESSSTDTDTNDTGTNDQPQAGFDDMPALLLPFIETAMQPISSVVDEVDEDIKEIFIEEAEEVLQTISPLFDEWRQKDDDQALLTDIRRGFHTLKGSGRMVGANQLGELAWAVENLLNRVLDGTVAADESIKRLLQAVLDGFGELVGLFANNTDTYPNEVVWWTALAHAYSKGLSDQLPYPFAGGATAQPVVQSDTSPQASVDVLGSIQEAKQVLVGAQVASPNDEEEDVLCQIFIEEAIELLATVKDFVAKHSGDDEVTVPDEVVRAFHTLRGATGLAPLVVVGEVGATIEQSLQQLQRHDTPMTDKHLQALGSAADLIEDCLANYHTNHALDTHELTETVIDEFASEEDAGFDVTGLIDGIDTLLDAELELENALAQSQTASDYAKAMGHDLQVLLKRTEDSPKFVKVVQVLTHAYDTLVKQPSFGQDDDLIDKLLAVHGELTGLFDSLAASMSLRLDDDVLRALADRLDELDGVMTDSTSLSDEPVVLEPVDTDAELLEIFLEEAGELDQAITQAFEQFKNNPSDTEALKALQRHLHTIKGGARLAGIGSIGDLTHEAETVYEQMVQGRLSPSAGWVNIMQGVQDILSLQIETLKDSQQTFYPKGAITQLQAFLSARVVGDDDTITLPLLQSETQETTPSVPESVDEPLSDFEMQRQRSWQGTMPDEDILGVFLEEAQELVESSGEDFQVFRSNTGDVATLQALQRKLHTIKGGARMVQASGVADLAHEMETVYEDLANRRRPATKMVVQLLQACHDWLIPAMVLLKATLNPPTPTALIEALKNFSRRPDSLTEVPLVSLNDELDAIAAHEAYEKAQRGGRDVSRMPPMTGLFDLQDDTSTSNEMIRISASLMERMINLSGEAAINRARIDMSMTSLTASIEEMGATAQRLADQLRRMDIELEAQILAQIDEFEYTEEGFDPLEMDQYSSLNQLSKSLSESASDLLDLKNTLLEKTRDGENLLLQLSRTQTELQDGLMYSRMVPFSRLTPRLQRIVRQVAGELGKQVELTIVNADDEMDRTILERITSPLEHMLRNAIDHGIEMPEERALLGKPKTGHIVLEAVREGGEILIHLSDDGAGVNVEAVRKKAISQGLIDPNDTSLADIDIMQYIFNAGLSTTNVVTQISGRGVGMDVVRSEIRQLGGSVSVDSVRHQGSRFTMRVPLTVAVADTLVVRAADRQYAIPLVQIDRVTQVSSKALLEYYQSTQATIDIGNEHYRLRYLNEILTGHDFSELLTSNDSLPVILIKNQMGQNLAIQVDEIIGSRIEVVVKPLGRQLSHVAGISSATIMGDGSVMFILDLMALIRNAQARVAVVAPEQQQDKRPVIMVVDDSVTVRKVTSRFLERQGFEVVVARDGAEAIEILQELHPDLMLLDIEMPRMDGFEVATQVRHNARLKELPIIMITSRTGEKHRERALEIGVNGYMGKPFQENELLSYINEHLGR